MKTQSLYIGMLSGHTEVKYRGYARQNVVLIPHLHTDGRFVFDHDAINFPTFTERGTAVVTHVGWFTQKRWGKLKRRTPLWNDIVLARGVTASPCVSIGEGV